MSAVSVALRVLCVSVLSGRREECRKLDTEGTEQSGPKESVSWTVSGRSVKKGELN
jgi:hypothetical protein